MVKRKERKESDQAQAATSQRAENSPEALVVGRQDSKADNDNPKIKLNPGTESEEILGPNSTKSNKPR